MNDFKDSLEEHLKLKDGWLDGDGKAISKIAAYLVLSEVEKRFASCPPHVFPTESGGLSLEWDFDDELDAVVEPSMKGMVLDNSGGQEIDWSFESSWEVLQSKWNACVGKEKRQ